MSLTAARLIQATNLYHPPKHTHTAIDLLIWVVCGVAFVVIVAGAATIARARETRRLAAQADHEPTP